VPLRGKWAENRRLVAETRKYCESTFATTAVRNGRRMERDSFIVDLFSGMALLLRLSSLYIPGCIHGEI
jgi:hypothetical protein